MIQRRWEYLPVRAFHELAQYGRASRYASTIDHLQRSFYFFPRLISWVIFYPFFMGKITVPVEMEFSDKLGKLQRMIILLRDHPEIRDSYELILSEWRKKYPLHKAKDQTILRMARSVQCDLGIYPASAEVRQYRRSAHLRIVNENRRRKANTKANRVKSVKSFFSKLMFWK